MAARALAGVTAADRLTVGHYMMRRWSLADDVRGLERLGFRSISLASSKLTAFGTRKAIRLLRSSSLQVAHMSSWGFFGTTSASARKGVESVRRALGWAHDLNAEVLVVISGSRGAEPWAQAATVFGDCYARLLPEAAEAGVRLAIEVIHPLRQDLSFINTIGDAGRLARAAGRRGGWVLDLWHSGWEPALQDVIRRDAARRIHAVQISDYKQVTTRSLDRALLGKGVLPLRAIFATLERGGYRGWYEIEIISDDVDRIGYERVLRQTRRTFERLMARQ
jgi:sugar phosphate isomerase/epimerase